MYNISIYHGCGNNFVIMQEAELAEQLGVKHLLLYHTEDKNLARRRELYTAEARQQFQGEVHVPEDLESYELV